MTTNPGSTGAAACLLLSVLLAWSLPARAVETLPGELVGQSFPGFSLPSTEGRLVEYANEYYGKHHLVLTLFPAAFTPV
jgi:hypothetical protein